MTGNELFDLIKKLYKKHGGFPPIWLISKESNIPQNIVEKALKRFVLQNKIIFKDGLYFFPEQLKKEKIKKDKFEIKSKFTSYLFCRIIMGIVGVACITCSIKFTYSFNKLSMPVFWAFVLSGAIMIFTSFCFTVREFLKEQGKKHQASLFIILYLFGITYSIFTAVAGQYNDFLIKNETFIENKNIENVNNKKYELLSEQKERYLEQIEKYKNQIIAQQKIIDNLSESPERKYEYNNTWKQANESVNNFNKEINILEDKINNIDLQLISSIDNNKTSKNIFDWIAELFGISSDLLQFIISLFPSIFIDLVSPFAISFAFYKK